MINAEYEIFDSLATVISAAHPTANIQSVTTLSPTDFPCVTIEEVDNYSNSDTADSSSADVSSVVTYEINIYTNNQNTAKSTAKSILATVDNAIINLGFKRISCMPYWYDFSTIYRIVARYTAVIGENEIIYRS